MNESTSPSSSHSNHDESLLMRASAVQSLAAQLVQARTQLGHTQGDAIEHIRCTPSIIQAIEQGDVKRIGGQVFARGYYKRYAEWLGEAVDAELYVAAMDELKPQNTLANYVPDATHARPDAFHGLFRRVMYIAMTAALVFPAYLALKHQLPEPIRAPVVLDQAGQSVDSEAQEIAVANDADAPVQQNESTDQTPMTASFTPNRSNQWSTPLVRTEVVPQAAPVATEDAVETASEAVPNVAADDTEATEQASQLVLTVTVDSWMKLTGADGKSLLSRVVKPGETLTFAADEVQNMVIGNTTGVQMRLNEQNVDLSPFKKGNMAKVSMAKLKQASE